MVLFFLAYSEIQSISVITDELKMVHVISIECVKERDGIFKKVLCANQKDFTN